MRWVLTSSRRGSTRKASQAIAGSARATTPSAAATRRDSRRARQASAPASSGAWPKHAQASSRKTPNVPLPKTSASTIAAAPATSSTGQGRPRPNRQASPLTTASARLKGNVPGSTALVSRLRSSLLTSRSMRYTPSQRRPWGQGVARAGDPGLPPRCSSAR